MPLTIDEAISRVPQWKNAVNIKTTALSGGITNNNFRIDVNGESFVLRIPGENTELLGINRNNEYAANLAAGKMGIAPEVYYYIQPEEFLITRFIIGHPLPPEVIKQPKNIERVMEIVRQIHAMQPIPGTFNSFQIVRNYTKVARDYGVEFPNKYNWLVDRLNEAEGALANIPNNPCPCHNDLLNANFLFNDNLYILDWEYAGMGDLFFDLANFSGNHNLSDEEDAWMLRCYFDNAITSDQLAHLNIMKIMSDLREATWGFVQIGISKLDFDFRGYADKFINRAMHNISSSIWNKWLKEVSYHV